MPELPEVETLRMGLEKYLVGHKILDVEVRVPKLFQGDPKNVLGARVESVKRAGKGIIINLDNGYSMGIHIKLTGQLVYQGSKAPKGVKVSASKVGEVPGKATHVIFTLDKNAFLYYNDVRRFGWIKVVKTDELTSIPFFKDLGPEPPIVKSDRPVLTFEKFVEIVENKNTAIKPLLMDQKKIGGIGNIYANDGLYLAKIDPRRKAKELSKVEVKKLYESLLEVLKRGLKYGGASELNYVNALGQEGSYQEHLLVYGQTGKSCKRCSGVIRRVNLGGRGTFYCPNCQK